MTTVSGSFAGRAKLQTAVALTDVANHELNLVEISGPVSSSDPLWEGARVTYWGIGDLVAGRGTQRGYFINDRADGDRDWGTFEGKINASGNQVTLEGTWAFAGGTGRLKGISGSGSYKGRMPSPTEVDMKWKGEYQLVQAKAAAK